MSNRDLNESSLQRVDLQNFALVPAALVERPQWCCWKLIRRHEGGKPTKVPFDAKTGLPASTRDPSTWCDYETALEACAGGGYDGIGFVFTSEDTFIGLDLDDCIGADGTVKPWARVILDRVLSYAEISPSGTGVKVFAHGALPEEGRRKNGVGPDGEGKVELYGSGRFFTVTGRRIEGSPAGIEDCLDPLLDVYRMIAAQPKPAARKVRTNRGSASAPPDDQRVIDALLSNPKAAELWRGGLGTFGSASEAELALVNHIAYYVGADADRIDGIFRQSGLFREKWERQDYRDRTIKKALAGRGPGNFYEWNRSKSVRGSGPLSQDEEGGAPRDDAAEEQDGRTGDVDPQDDARGDGLVPLGQRDPVTGRVVLSPKRTLPTAKTFVCQFHTVNGIPTLHGYAGGFLEWKGNRYVEVEPDALRQVLQPWLHGALRYYRTKSGDFELVDFESNPATVNAALESVRTYTHLPVTQTPPCWLDRRAGPDPKNLLPFPSGTLDLDSGQILVPTPALFNVNAIDFEYDPKAPPPATWLKFLAQLWPDDPEAIQLLQEWMGYCLTGDTGQQKALLIVGPKRSGKGTIGRVLTRLVGAGNVAGPTTSSLAGAFGLQPLIGKSLAVVSDARFAGENISTVVERLLCITGEDTLTVDRKFLGSVTMKLPTRFVFLTNELPGMKDASGALAGRFVILRLTNSFFGKEDVNLTSKLAAELRGILLWAIEGLKRLRERGYFVQPQSVADAVQEMEDLASPVLAFVRERCEVGPGHRAWVSDIYTAWKQWCESEGRTHPTTCQIFGRDLAAALPGIRCRRDRTRGRFYEGISLRTEP
jgi:putative DNA primase/helicase